MEKRHLTMLDPTLKDYVLQELEKQGTDAIGKFRGLETGIWSENELEIKDTNVFIL